MTDPYDPSLDLASLYDLLPDTVAVHETLERVEAWVDTVKGLDEAILALSKKVGELLVENQEMRVKITMAHDVETIIKRHVEGIRAVIRNI